MANLKVVLLLAFHGVMMAERLEGTITSEYNMKMVATINKGAPFIGLLVPNAFEMRPLLQSHSFIPCRKLPYMDIGGKRFRFGIIGKAKVIVVMTGLSMLNAGLSTQLLLTMFKVKGVVNFGVAGNANTNLEIGDVTIPRHWAHTGLWYWQRYMNGPDDELEFESSGDYTRKIGYLNFSNYDAVIENMKSGGNFLGNVWYQPEEVYPVNGIPEVRHHAFWVPVDKYYYALSKKLEGMTLEKCVNSTICLPRSPKVVRVRRGCSANTFVDNAAYRKILRSKFRVTPIDMESAAVALVCLQQQTSFIAIRSLSDLAGGGSSLSNEASEFSSLAAQNAVIVLIQFLSLLD